MTETHVPCALLLCVVLRKIATTLYHAKIGFKRNLIMSLLNVDGVWKMSEGEAVWNTDILSLAVLSEHSCAAEYRRAGKAVLKLFPHWMVKQERENYKKGTKKAKLRF